jgi:hypothetical protein
VANPLFTGLFRMVQNLPILLKNSVRECGRGMPLQKF